jgi:hypothetical protein
MGGQLFEILKKKLFEKITIAKKNICFQKKEKCLFSKK